MAFNGMANSMGIGLAIYLDDQFSKSAQAVKDQMGLLGVSAQQLEKNFQDMGEFGVGLETLGKGILSFANTGLQAYGKYDDLMNSVRVIAQIPKEQAKKDLAELNTLNMRVAKQYGILPDAVASAQLELAKAGKKGLEIQNMTESVMALGAATDTQVDGVNGAAEVLVNIMQAFGAASQQSSRYAAVITSAANQSTIDVRDFFQSMRYAGDVAKSMNVPIEEAAAVIATLGNAGLKGSVAGTSYANMIRYLSTALSDYKTLKQDKAFEDLGISTKEFLDAEGNMKSMTEILDVFRSSLSKLNQQQAFQASQAIFGVRGARGGSPLLTNLVEAQEGIYSFEDNLRKIIEDRDSNVHIDQATERLDDYMGDLQRFRTSLQAMYMNFGASIAPYARNFLQRATSAIDKVTHMMETPFMQKAFAAIAGSGLLMVVVGKVLQGVAGFGLYLLNFTRNFSNMMRTFVVTTSTQKQVLKQSGSTFIAAAKTMLLAAEKNLIASRGMSTRAAAGGGMMIQGRNAKGQFAKGVKANWFTKYSAILFGKAGLRQATRVMEWFGKIGTKLPWLSKFFSQLPKVGRFLGLFGRLLGGVVAKLFSWPVVIADLVGQMVFGVGIFELLWEGIKYLINNVDKVSSWLDKLGDYIANAFSLGLYGLVKGAFNGEGWSGFGGLLAKDLGSAMKSGTSSLLGSMGIAGGSSSEDKSAYGEYQKQRDASYAKQWENMPTPMLFNEGQLVPNTEIKDPKQLSPKKTVTTNKQTVVEKKPVNITLNVQAPATGTLSKNLRIDDDNNLLGAAIY